MSDPKESTEKLNSNPITKPSNGDPTVGTSSEPNALKREVTVGRKGYVKEASHSTIESLRPSEGEIKNG